MDKRVKIFVGFDKFLFQFGLFSVERNFSHASVRQCVQLYRRRHYMLRNVTVGSVKRPFVEQSTVDCAIKTRFD